MKSILVTGGCGFIGSNFVRYLLQEIQDIHVANDPALGIKWPAMITPVLSEKDTLGAAFSAADYF